MYTSCGDSAGALLDYERPQQRKVRVGDDRRIDECRTVLDDGVGLDQSEEPVVQPEGDPLDRSTPSRETPAPGELSD